MRISLSGITVGQVAFSSAHSQSASLELMDWSQVISYFTLQSSACSSQAILHCRPMFWQYASQLPYLLSKRSTNTLHSPHTRPWSLSGHHDSSHTRALSRANW